MRTFCLTFFFICTFISVSLRAQQNAKPGSAEAGTIHGKILDDASGRFVEFVNVTVCRIADSAIVTGQVTGKNGEFRLEQIPPGEYFLRFRLLGYEEKSSARFTIDATHLRAAIGDIRLKQTTVDLDEVIVRGEKSMYNNSIDRKVYNVDQDMMSKASSASELLQNVPSVEVDIDGNVSLRGSGNVLIMVNGKSSPMMDKNSATVLQQMPANSIEKIEVITNPSAKYRPEGSSGILNIVLKKNTALGTNGSVTLNGALPDRYNGNVRLNHTIGNLNLFGSIGLRRDNRNRFNSDVRDYPDSVGNAHSYGATNLHGRQESEQFSGGAELQAGDANQLSFSGDLFRRRSYRSDDATTITNGGGGPLSNAFARAGWQVESGDEYTLKGGYEHKFAGEDHEVKVEGRFSHEPEIEEGNNNYTYWLPAPGYGSEYTRQDRKNNQRELTVDYTNQLDDQSTLEAGYSGEFNTVDQDVLATVYDVTSAKVVPDLRKINVFSSDDNVNAVYATLKHSFGSFGVLAGLRGETVTLNAHQHTTAFDVQNHYSSIYPSLHLSEKLSEAAELRLSYSKRTNRPEGDDLNPFPEYRDTRNVTAGNPYLLPEYTHSFDFGCQLQTNAVSVLPSVFYRYTYNRFTQVSTLINDTVLYTTRTNLANDRSGGVELLISGDIGELVSLHWNASGFYNEIDAVNLGYGDKKAITSWTSNLTMNWRLGGGSRVQINSNYQAPRLTPQGETKPSVSVNIGVRQDLLDGQLSLVATATDIFQSVKREVVLNTGSLVQDGTSIRDSRVVYFGVAYTFGSSSKKRKQEQIRYEDLGGE